MASLGLRRGKQVSHPDIRLHQILDDLPEGLADKTWQRADCAIRRKGQDQLDLVRRGPPT